MNFRPEKVFLGKNPDGSNLRIEEWNYDTRAGYELAGSFINLFSVVFFIQIISPFILILTILNFNGQKTILNLIGLVLGSYFLYDAYSGWLVTNFLRILLSENIMNILIYLNAISVVLHAVLLIFGGVIYNVINSTCDTLENCKQTFMLIVVFIGFFSGYVTNGILNDNPGWLDKNIQECLERNKEPEPIEVKEPEPTYDDGYFHPDPDFLKELDN